MKRNHVRGIVLNTILNSVLSAVFGATLAFALPPQQADAGTQKKAADAAQANGVTVHENIVYATVNGTELHLDIFEPPDRGSQTRPAILLLHGGGWTSFDKSTMRKLGEFFARSGFVAVAADYRLFNAKDSVNRWPAQLDDVQRAVRWVRANAAKYGVNPERLGVFGHSAGAQLASLLGMEDTRDNSDPALAKYSSRVQAVVDASGPTDFTTDHDADGDAFLSSFLGGDFATHPELWREASPVFHVAKGNAAFLILHGTKDQDVPISQAQELYDKLKAAKVKASFVKFDDGHVFESPDARRELAIQSRDFFFQYLASSK
jgi:acetyl esterase/lipase